MKLTSILGQPVNDEAIWLSKEFLSEERHRLKYEQLIAKQGGERLTVTPYFTVNVELPRITELTAETFYGATYRQYFSDYLKIREERRRLYVEQSYSSTEIINGHLYAIFFQRQKVFQGISEKEKNQQIDAILKSLQFSNVQRRVYLGYDLPIVTWYSAGTALLRFDEFTIEVTGDKFLQDIKNVFYDFYSRCELKSSESVENFIRNPLPFISNVQN